MLTIVILFVFVYLSNISVINGQTSDDTKNLITALFTTNKYNKNVMPSNDLKQPLVLDVDLTLVGINGLDELEQKLTTTGYLYIAWNDIYLTWNSATYNGLSKFSISQKEVWRPDITLQNGFNKFESLGSDFIQATITNDGAIYWIPFEVFETKCSVNIKYFPFDKQTCALIFVVWSGSSSDIMVTLWQNGITLEDVDEDGMWSIESTSAVEEVRSLESRVKFSITLKRNPTYYVYNLILPIIFLSILTVFTFVLPADSGEKMGYSMTVFLSFAVFITILSAELPKTPGAILVYYMMFELAIGTFIVCFTAVELRLHHRKDPVPHKIEKLMKLKFCKRPCKDRVCAIEKKPVKDAENDKNMSWDDVISWIDFILFWFMVFLKFVVTLIFMIVIVYNL